ncbi:FecR family protein [Parahaliea mediterranea]|uniref:FecR family protein n=1 Tax=Parahaliea mediterranea TaxID=651086 RepID=UPI000E2F88BC|nr:FecR domain-containing protein [Parahaliea mediterranea]
MKDKNDHTHRGTLPDEQVGHIARDWMLRKASGKLSSQEEAALQAWLDADERHRLFYRQSQRTWRALGELKDLRGKVSPELLEARQYRWWQPRFPRLSWAGWGVTVVALLLVFLLPAYLLPSSVLAPGVRFSTGTGEIRQIRLDEGSTITLGARSVVQVQLSADWRRVQLVEGEAFFDVARDEKRPFQVRAGDTEVSVLGTRFEIHKGARRTRISVEQGLVSVRSAGPSTSPMQDAGAAGTPTTLLLSGGESAFRDAGETWLRQRAATRHSANWRDGRLAYDGAPLREVVADINRHHDRQIMLDDPNLGDLRVTASFRAADIGKMISLLENGLGLRAEPVDADKLVLFADEHRQVEKN